VNGWAFTQVVFQPSTGTQADPRVGQSGADQVGVGVVQLIEYIQGGHPGVVVAAEVGVASGAGVMEGPA